ncbi:MAG: VOC family protein [Patescibacteria group bacterium]
MKNLNPYLRFNDGKCREAMTFYKDCLGGELTFQTIGESPMAKEMPVEKGGLIMHAGLKSGTIEFFASDMMQDKAVVGDNMAMALNTTDEKEARKVFADLSRGGEVFMPLEKAFWGALFGVVTDKYGIEWMVNCEEVKK